MNIKLVAKTLLTFALLASQSHVCAQVNMLGNTSIVAVKDTVQSLDTLSAYDVSIVDMHKDNGFGFNAKQLILPGSLIAVGTFGVYNGAFKKLDIKIRNEMDHLRGEHFFHADDYIQYLPALTYLTFGSIGVKSKNSFKERVVVEATAYLAMAALTNIGKYTFKEKRPDSGARNSFPSGHTATVFTGAELMREEYGFGIGIGAYSVATAVAFLRLYNGRHWLNDVIAGASIGILSARIGYWMLPLYQRWFKWGKPNSAPMIISPTYNITEHCGSIAVLYSF